MTYMQNVALGSVEVRQQRIFWNVHVREAHPNGCKVLPTNIRCREAVVDHQARKLIAPVVLARSQSFKLDSDDRRAVPKKACRGGVGQAHSENPARHPSASFQTTPWGR